MALGEMLTVVVKMSKGLLPDCGAVPGFLEEDNMCRVYFERTWDENVPSTPFCHSATFPQLNTNEHVRQKHCRETFRMLHHVECQLIGRNQTWRRTSVSHHSPALADVVYGFFCLRAFVPALFTLYVYVLSHNCRPESLIPRRKQWVCVLDSSGNVSAVTDL